jgi:hypothetical protein
VRILPAAIVISIFNQPPLELESEWTNRRIGYAAIDRTAYAVDKRAITSCRENQPSEERDLQKRNAKDNNLSSIM